MITGLAIIALGAAVAPPGAGEAAFEQCIQHAARAADFRPCYAVERTRLRAEQGDLLKRLFSAFARSGPKSTDHSAAAAALQRAQAHWRAYVDEDCAAFAHAFGNELAFGLPGENCIVDHYRTRNAVLRDLTRSVRMPTADGKHR